MGENRRSIRVRTGATVDVAADSEVLLFHRIRDIGEGGLCVEFPNLEPVGSEVDLSIGMAGSDETLECTGVVVRASDVPVRHLGIRFKELTEEQMAVLRRFLGAGKATADGEGGVG